MYVGQKGLNILAKNWQQYNSLCDWLGLEVALGEGGALIGEEARLVLLQELVQVRLQLVPVAVTAVAEPDERGVHVHTLQRFTMIK